MASRTGDNGFYSRSSQTDDLHKLIPVIHYLTILIGLGKERFDQYYDNVTGSGGIMLTAWSPSGVTL